jgi:CDGSH-type Zn-finger protein
VSAQGAELAPSSVSGVHEPLVEIKVRDGGPYKVTGPVRLIDAEGGVFEVEEGRPIALCRCGHSTTKPFCDASHKPAGFDSCPRAAAQHA